MGPNVDNDVCKSPILHDSSYPIFNLFSWTDAVLLILYFLFHFLGSLRSCNMGDILKISESIVRSIVCQLFGLHRTMVTICIEQGGTSKLCIYQAMGPRVPLSPCGLHAPKIHFYQNDIHCWFEFNLMGLQIYGCDNSTRENFEPSLIHKEVLSIPYPLQMVVITDRTVVKTWNVEHMKIKNSARYLENTSIVIQGLLYWVT